jgi:hypothetical protein
MTCPPIEGPAQSGEKKILETFVAIRFFACSEPGCGPTLRDGDLGDTLVLLAFRVCVHGACTGRREESEALEARREGLHISRCLAVESCDRNDCQSSALTLT